VDDLEQRLERFYRQVRAEAPVTPPAWDRQPRRRQGMLVPILASVALVVMAFGLAIALNRLHVGQRGPAGAGIESTPPTSSTTEERALSLGAVTTSNGTWVVERYLHINSAAPVGPDNLLLQTSDGGKTWQRRLAFDGGYDGMSWEPDGRRGVLWTLDFGRSYALQVYATTDSGQHWTRHRGTSWPAEYVYFRGTEGWALSTGPTTGGQTTPIYHTADAGASWTQVGAWPGTFGSWSHTSGVREALFEFAAPQIGWFATGSVATPGDSGLVMTRDGGRSWRSVAVPTPVGMQGADMILGYPQLLGDGVALLPVRFGHSASRIAGDPNSFSTSGWFVYTSRDGGLTWTDPVAVRAGAVQPGGSEYTAFYLDANHWWFTTFNDHPSNTPVASPNQVLARTTDGGRTWQTFPAPAIIQMLFSDPSNGWAEGVIGPYNTNIMLRTTDGGAHWQQVRLP
jgi:photosystem II stability/assembly factor-like uncharacterized protein